VYTLFVIYLNFLEETIAFSMSTPTNTNKNSSNNDSFQLLSSSEVGDMQFGKFIIPKASIFARSQSSAAFVNLRPIVPGHVLVMPERIVPHLEDLSTTEYTDLWLLVRQIQSILKKQYKATAFNVAVQDGRAAGQSVPHVHVHILPRSAGDFTNNDDIYDSLEEWAPLEGMMKQKTNIDVPDDKDRVDRTIEMMAEEAATYRQLLEQQQEQQ
jgi:bis(5'-adenosyl)-triphosphatase